MNVNSTTAVIVTFAIMTLAPAIAPADSIYLKNGRVIRAYEARVEGDQVVFSLHGADQTIPLALVDRVEDDDWRGPGAPPRSPDPPDPVTAGAADLNAASDTLGRVPPPLADMAPAARLDALAGFLGDGGAETGALNLLQALSGLQGSDGGGGLAALAPLLGALGGAGDGGPLGVLGGLGSLGADAVQVQAILPTLTRLGAALFAPEYSAAATDAAARELLLGLSRLGVSDADIRAKARQFGLPEDILNRIGRR